MADIVERLTERFRLRYMANCKCGKCQLVPLEMLGRAIDTLRRQREEFDANVNRLKACEHIADGDDGWKRFRNECPSTAAVARLRDGNAGWRPVNEAPEGVMLLFRCPKIDRGLPGCEVLMVYHNRDIGGGRTYWTNGGPNAGDDFYFEPNEEPTDYMPLPSPTLREK